MQCCNRNRRNRNFLPCGTGTRSGPVTCQKVRTGTVIKYGSGTVIKWYHKSSHKPTQNCVFDFLHLTFFSFTFYHKFDETYQIFPYKKAYNVKRKDFSKIFLKTIFFWSRYGTGTVTFQSRNRNLIFSKVGTGTVKNSYGSTTLVVCKSSAFGNAFQLIMFAIIYDEATRIMTMLTVMGIIMMTGRGSE
jgi:hypothetical protein